MRFIIYLGVFAIILHSIEKEELNQFSQNEICYSACYKSGTEKYAISFDIKNPNNGTICKIEGFGLRDLNVFIENNEISQALYSGTYGTEVLHPSLAQPLLKYIKM